MKMKATKKLRPALISQLGTLEFKLTNNNMESSVIPSKTLSTKIVAKLELNEILLSVLIK